MAGKLYDIWIKNYQSSSGTLVTQDTLMFSVPLNYSANPDNVLINPVVKTEMGKTGTLEFSLYPNHPMYSCWNQLKTILRVDYDGDCLFRGRVLTIDVSPMTGEKKIHCEGDLAFLMDSIQEAVKEEERTEISLLTYLTNLIDEHNRQMRSDGDIDKIFTLGEVPGHYSDSINAAQKVFIPEATKKYGEASYQQTMQRLESLQKEYGGFFRTRFANGVCYLDWLDYAYRYEVNGQAIALGENLIDISSSTEVDQIFTALIPLGKKQGNDVTIKEYRTDIHGENNRILVPQIVSLFTDEELNKGYHAKSDYQNAVAQYGIIYKTQNFPNADTPEKLWEYATDWIRENYAGGVSTFNLTALDMHHEDGAVRKYLAGDRVIIRYPDTNNPSGGTIQKTLTLLTAQYILYNPEKNTYTAGIVNNQLNRTYGISKKGKGGGGASGKSGSGNRDAELEEMERQARWQEYRRKANLYIVDQQYNNTDYKELVEENETAAEWAVKMTAGIITQGLAAEGGDASTEQFRRRLQSMKLNGTFHRMEFNDKVHVDILADWTDEDIDRANKLTQTMYIDGLQKELGLNTTAGLISGSDPAHWSPLSPSAKLKMKLTEKKNQSGEIQKEEASVSLWDDSVRQLLSPEPTINLFGEDGAVNNIVSKLGLDGSGESTTINLDGLTSAVKLFNPGSVVTDPSHPKNTIDLDGNAGTGKVGKSADGTTWKVKLNDTVSYTDEGGTLRSLDGFVSAEDFSIPNVPSFKTKLIVTDELIADRATIAALEAAEARIETLEADAITANTLQSAIAAINILGVNGIDLSDVFLYQGEYINLSTKEIVTGVTISRAGAHFYLYSSANGSITPSGTTYGTLVTSVSVSTDTLNYLGYSSNSGS